MTLNLVALVISLSTLGRRASCAPLRDLRDQLRGTVLNITRPVPSPVPPAVLTVLPEVAQPEAVTQPPVQPSVVIQPQPAPAPQAPPAVGRNGLRRKRGPLRGGAMCGAHGRCSPPV